MEIHLAKRPFDVLLFLIQNRNRVVGRDELLNVFWEGHEVYDDALRKCIGAIRKALDDTEKSPRFIETRRGSGYRFVGLLSNGLEPVGEVDFTPEISNLKSRKSDLNSEISDFKFQSGAQKSGDTGHARSRNPGFLPRTFFACAIGIALVSLVVLGLVAFRQGSDAASTSLIETVPARRSIAIPPGTAAPKAEFHAQRALILDADLAGAYIVLGAVRTMKNYDLRTREDYYKQALVKNPNHRTARL